MGTTKIEYLDKSWNPIKMRCTKVSPGCDNCWHLAMAKRHAANPMLSKRLRAARGGGAFYLDEKELEAPLRARKPYNYGVQFMGDHFHPGVLDDWILQIWGMMASNFRHTFLVLTKRAEHMSETVRRLGLAVWPNIRIGVTVENQGQADKRIPALLRTPAANRFVSVEPMLGPIDLSEWLGWTGKGSGLPAPLSTSLEALPDIPSELSWVICGGESGPGARSMYPAWPRALRDQCQAAQVPFFFKQWGEWGLDKSRDIDSRRLMHRIGKKKAGRLLGGREWNECPENSRK